MSVDIVRGVLGWCAVINMGLLLWWFLMFAFAHDWIYRMHGKWFKMSVETFNAIHYGGMGIYKIIIIVFNLLPYIVLRIVM